MWCPETLKIINQKAAELAREGKPERDAVKEVINEKEKQKAA